MDSRTDATEAGTLGADGSGRKPLAIARGSQIGRYVLLNPIGRGAAGQVWVAHDADLDRRVAIKVLDAVVGADPQRRRRLLAEAQAMAKVRHVNVVAVFDVGTHEDRVYIAMELVEGTTLRAWCSALARPRAAIVAAFLAAARGLAAAHAAGLVHRDFKPDNVLVEGDAAHGAGVKVADFGLAHGTSDNVAMTSDGAGTPAYMSPEHHGRGVVDARSDQFSFCIALFEALWGHRPFRGDSPAAIAAATCGGEIDDAGDAAIPGRLRRVVLQGLARSPEQRHASMDALIDALERATRRRGPRIAVAVAGAMIPAGIWMALVRTPEVDPCTRGAEIIAAAWGPTQRGQIAVTETGFAPAFVAGRTERLRTSLDDYAGRWAQLHDEVCTTQRDDDDGDSGGDVRIECLEDRRASFETLTAALATQPIDPPSIDAVLADLPALSACRATGVGAWTPMPEDQGMRASVTELRAELRLLGVKREMGAPGSELRAALDDLLGRAEAVGYPHLVASVEAEFGALELQEGRIERSLALLDAALVRALEHGHGRVAAAAIVTMLMVSKRSPTTPIDAERLGRIAKAVVVAAGGDDGISGKIASAVGALRFEGGDVRGAASAFAEASVALERAFGPQAPQLVRPRLAQSLALLSLGDTDGAERVVATVTPIIDAAFDQGHELVIEAASLRAGISDIQGDWRRALALYLEALHTAQEVHGDRDASISALAYNVAAVAAMHGLVDIARENLTLSRRAWPVRDDPVAEGEFLQVEASIALAAGEWIEAIRLADAGAVELEKAGGARNHRIAAVRLTRATAQLAQRRYDDVLATVSAPDWSVGFEPHDRGRLGVIAATALGDPLAAARWLGFAEAGPETALVPSRTLTRLLVFPRPTPEQQASARTARAAVADATFAGDPVLAVFDEWLAGRWPPDASSAFAPLGSVRTHQ